MSSKNQTLQFISNSLTNSQEAAQLLKSALKECDAVIIGAGAGLSTAAGYTYSGPRFKKYFSDFIEKYHFTDMYSAGFYPFATQEERWAYWSRYIFYNRYVEPPHNTYELLLSAVADKDYFVITTNVDHAFQRSGFDKNRLWYMQGDYGLWQCSTPCHNKTYDNEELVKLMVEHQKNMRIPTALVPRCPRCGKPMGMNLRADQTFVEDKGWQAAARRYQEFIQTHKGSNILYLELGVGFNTPSIIKYPFWNMTFHNKHAKYFCISKKDLYVPVQIKEKSTLVDSDIHEVLTLL